MSIDQGMVQRAMERFCRERDIVGVDGPLQATDFFGQPYTVLGVGIQKPYNEMERYLIVPAYFYELDYTLWECFENFFDDWLEGRRFVVWRRRVELGEDEVEELLTEDEDPDRRTAREDNNFLYVPKTRRVKRYKISARLSAYAGER